VPSCWTGWVRNLSPFFRLRINLFDSAKAVGFGIVRTGNEGSAHLRAVPAGYDAKPKRLFRFDVTWREILHGLYAFRLAFDRRSSAWKSPAFEDRDCSAPVGEPGKISKDGCDQIAMMGIARRKTCDI
jgi:hypothetical protein